MPGTDMPLVSDVDNDDVSDIVLPLRSGVFPSYEDLAVCMFRLLDC